MLRIFVEPCFFYVATFTSQTNRPSAEMLDRYFAGDVTPAEAECVRAWAAQSVGGDSGLEALRRMRVGAVPSTWDPLSRWTEMARRLTTEREALQSHQTAENTLSPEVSADTKLGAPTLQTSPRPRTRFLNKRIPSTTLWYSFAGSLLAILLLVLGWNSGVHRVSESLSAHASVYTTARGERGTVTLPDGSTVILNVASRLEVPADYGVGNRTVRLYGEGLFTIAHRAQAPFTVLTGASTTRVLGTRFVVRHYATDSVVTVAVRDGKVAVQSSVVSANQEVHVKGRKVSPVQSANPGQFTFATGVLTLDNMPLAQAIPELERWYDVDIQCSNDVLTGRRVKGRFVAGSLSDLTEILEWTFNLRVVRDGRILTLYSR
jgi:ferric-dicitrate binding protein FerR (iron transport regulator)